MHRFCSVFSGIGGFDLGFERAGWEVVSQIEIDTFIDPKGKRNITGRYAKKVLDHHWPDVPLLDDVRTIHGTDIGDIDVLVGGFPCQDTSRAAPNRDGLKGSRSHAFFDFVRLADEYIRLVDETNPRWIILENPDGILHANGGADFRTVLETLADLGYVGTWRLVTARGVGLPQRRDRVLLVGHRGEHPGARAVLRDPRASSGDPGAPDEGRRGEQGGRPAGPSSPQDRLGRVLFRKSRRPRSKDDYETWVPEDFSNCLTGFDGGYPGRATQMIVEGDRLRSLTFTEWERLQGFPDGWTDVPGMKDSYRWTLLGNAMAVPMAEWLAHRINSIPLLAAA